MRVDKRIVKYLGVTVAAAALVGGLMTATASASPGTYAAPVVAAPAVATLTVDDATTRGANRFSYSGSWRVCAKCSRAALGGSFHYTDQVRATAGLTFEGNRATLYGFKQRNGGVAAVYVDGRFVGTAGFASRRARVYSAIYTTPWLRAGRHTVTLKVLPRPRGKGRAIFVDKAVVTMTVTKPQGPPPTKTPPTTAPTTSTRPAPTTTTTKPATTTTSTTSTTTRPPAGPGTGIASLTFDDGKSNQFQNVRPALRAAGVNGTFYIISDALTWGSSSMTADQVRQVAADGNEIGSHTKTHANLTTLSESAVDAELGGSLSALRSATGITPTTCAYPYGQSNTAVRTIAAKYYSACRGTNGGTNVGGFDRYDLRTFYVTTGTSVSAVRDAAASAKAKGEWIVFIWHGVGTVDTTDDVTTQQFTEELQAIKDTGISIRTVASALSAAK